MKILIGFTILFCVFIAPTSGMGQNAQPPSGNLSAGRPLEVDMTVMDASRQPQPIEVTAGQEFKLILESNRTTGYRWQLGGPLNEGIIQLIGAEYQPPESKLPGAGGREAWTFKALRPGTAEIRLNYIRPWEKGVAPLKTRSFVVNVG